MEIPFTQYKRPDGRKSKIHWDTDQPDSIASGFTYEHKIKAQSLIDAGCRFEIEVLATGEVHMDCQIADRETVLANAICENNDDVPRNVVVLVERAFIAL